MKRARERAKRARAGGAARTLVDRAERASRHGADFGDGVNECDLHEWHERVSGLVGAEPSRAEPGPRTLRCLSSVSW